ncbi:MAG: hypothetical protein JRJ03_00270 [Deltaproteobacteria bacterium]|nr:hypothetical protein [Deltaproteobacteria bacterium]
MTNNPKRILSINPGSRYLGIAVFQDLELIEWGIRSVNGKCQKEKREAAKGIISDLILRYQPNVLALKKLHPSRSSPNLDNLVCELRKLGRKKSLRIFEYPLEKIETSFSGAGKINKRQMAELIIREYPFLSNEFRRENTNLNPYHIRMFEAVALGLVYLHHIDKSMNH